MARTPHLYGATFALIVNEKNQILMLQRKNTWYFDWWWMLPAGHIEDGELATESIRHECLEELGITIKVSAQDHIHTLHKITADRQYFDICFRITKRIWIITNQEPEKCSALERFDIDKLPSYITHEAKRFIQAWKDGENFSELRIES